MFVEGQESDFVAAHSQQLTSQGIRGFFERLRRSLQAWALGLASEIRITFWPMAKVNCPHCAASAVRVALIDGYKFYCSRCGWNRELVPGELSSTIKVSLILMALGLVLAVVARIKSPSEGWAWAGILLASSGLPIYYTLSAFQQMRKLRSLSFQSVTNQPPTIAISQMSPSGVPTKTIAFQETEFPELAALARPRKLKMTWKGRFYLVFALVVVILFTVYGLPGLWSEFNNPHSSHGRIWSLVAPLVVIYGYSFVFFRNRLRERRLLSNGELTSGYVTAQNTGHYTQQSIQYCFKLSGGRLEFGRCNDASRSLYEGMTVPVFYDADNPKHSIPLDCSLTKIAKVLG